MATENSRPAAPSADSYIGSLISLTSKYEIRYEGILYNINTEESSIGLRNVRSFGTEGRKKDASQIPASDKIYEYILFRGSDIKDLQVKSSPPVQSALIHNDPAIIQSHYSHPAMTSTSLNSVGNGSVSDPSPHSAHLGLPRPTFQGGLSLYQPGGSLGTWGSAQAPPTANASGLPMPMYWQGFYAPPGGLPHLQQTPLFRPPSGLPIHQPIQQPLQYPGVNASIQSGPQNVADISPPLFPPVCNAQNLASATLPSTVAPAQVNLLAPETASNLMLNRPPATSLPSTSLGGNLQLLPPLTSGYDHLLAFSQNMPLVSTKPMNTTPPTFGYQSISQSTSSVVGMSAAPTLGYQPSSQAMPSVVGSSALPTSGYQTTGQAMPSIFGSFTAPISSHQMASQAVPSIVGSSNSNLVEPPMSLVTPDQLLNPGPSAKPSSQPLQMSHKEVEVKPHEAEAKPSIPKSSARDLPKVKEPILPLPKPAHLRPNGALLHNHHHYNRGRGRGRGFGSSRPMTKFTEDFDFMAMNEKFNKDEVWGSLGKTKAQSHYQEGEKDDESDDNLEDGDAESPKPVVKPVYVKDDFFDTLSCNTLDRDARGGRTKFSEQLKIDTETFGDISRHRPYRGGGRGPRGGGGRARGFYGRGHGFVARGRGRGDSNRAS